MWQPFVHVMLLQHLELLFFQQVDICSHRKHYDKLHLMLCYCAEDFLQENNDGQTVNFDNVSTAECTAKAAGKSRSASKDAEVTQMGTNAAINSCSGTVEIDVEVKALAMAIAEATAEVEVACTTKGEARGEAEAEAEAQAQCAPLICVVGKSKRCCSLFCLQYVTHQLLQCMQHCCDMWQPR